MPSVNASGSWGYNYSLNPVTKQVPVNPYVPIIAANGDTTAYAFNPNPTYVPVTPPGGSQSLSYSASANLNLFNGGADAAEINVAEAKLGSDHNTAIWTRQTTAYNVTKAYLNVLLNNELIDAADSTLAEALAQLSLVKGQYDAGVVPIVQFYQQDAVVGQDSLQLIQAVNNYKNAKIALLFLLNIPPNEYNTYTFTAEGIDTSTSAASRAAVDTSIASSRFNAVIDKRPDVIAQQQSIEASQYTIDVTRGALYPSLGASVSIGGAGDGSSFSQIRFGNSFNAGLTLNIPIFDKMQNRLLIDEEGIEVESQQVQLQQVVQQARSDAAMAVNNLQAADEALDASDGTLRSALEGLRLAEEQLTVGSGTQVSVVVAEATLETARTNRVNAKYNWVLAQQQLAYTLGQWNY